MIGTGYRWSESKLMINSRASRLARRYTSSRDVRIIQLNILFQREWKKGEIDTITKAGNKITIHPDSFATFSAAYMEHSRWHGGAALYHDFNTFLASKSGWIHINPGALPINYIPPGREPVVNDTFFLPAF